MIAWFATHNLSIDKSGLATPAPIIDFKQSTIFIFRCPTETVFSYEQTKPMFLTNIRPDRQHAWFGHCGWGLAKNQSASYLVCGIRLDTRIHDLFEKGYTESLFPGREDDFVLDYFLNMKENERNKREVKRALERIYYL